VSSLLLLSRLNQDSIRAINLSQVHQLGFQTPSTLIQSQLKGLMTNLFMISILVVKMIGLNIIGLWILVKLLLSISRH